METPGLRAGRGAGLALLLPFAALGAWLLFASARAALAPAHAPGDLAPELPLRRLDGGTFELASARGRVVLLELWATWCPGCRAYAPVMRRLDRDYAARGLLVVGVNAGESVAAVERYVAEHELAYPQVIDPGVFAETYGLFATPAFVLVDRRGRVSAIGPRIEAEVLLRERVEALLAEAP